MKILKYKLTYFFLLLTLILCFFSNSATAYKDIQPLPNGIFDYQERVGNKITPFDWKVEQSKSGVTVIITEEGKTFYNYCTRDGATLKWHIKVEGKHDIIAAREGNTIRIQGIRFGKEYSEVVAIDDRPWYQPLSFSLGKFLSSADNHTSFWVIRADKIDVITLTAEKLGVEELLVNGTKEKAQKVKVRAEGFYSSFWSAAYWYRKSDNLFLRYQSVHGLPGTDETVIELTSSPH